jgi:hypothetical protein
LLIGRKALAPRKLFRRKEDMAIGKWEDFLPLFERHKNKTHENGYYLNYSSVPQDIKRAITLLPPSEHGKLEGLSYDQVLDREIVEKYR